MPWLVAQPPSAVTRSIFRMVGWHATAKQACSERRPSPSCRILYPLAFVIRPSLFAIHSCRLHLTICPIAPGPWMKTLSGRQGSFSSRPAGLSPSYLSSIRSRLSPSYSYRSHETIVCMSLAYSIRSLIAPAHVWQYFLRWRPPGRWTPSANRCSPSPRWPTPEPVVSDRGHLRGGLHPGNSSYHWAKWDVNAESQMRCDEATFFMRLWQTGITIVIDSPAHACFAGACHPGALRTALPQPRAAVPQVETATLGYPRRSQEEINGADKGKVQGSAEREGFEERRKIGFLVY